MIGQTISHYRILSRLGAGGMGIVFEAEDTRLGRKVAIKFLPDEISRDAAAAERFELEARVISKLNHPHICTLHDIGDHEGRQFMVMELLDGQSLKDRIARGPLPMDEVLEVGAQLSEALDAAHAQGVVHRDIKPANLFVTSRGVLKVLDFGVAKISQTGKKSGANIDETRAATDQLTTAGTTVGTVSYMSPEQARGHDIDARSDLFSAGVVLYESATGRLPFPGATVATIFEGLLTKAPAPPSRVHAGIPPGFDQLVLKALEKDRETRYQGAAELRADIKRLKRATESGVTPAVTPRPGDVAPDRAPTHQRARLGGISTLVGAPLVIAALIGGLMVYRSVTTPALTDKDPVVLSSMVNRTGDPMFDDTLGEALALQLRQSPFLNVTPEQQVQATLRLMGRDPMTAITPEVGRELCQRAGAKALLGGTIAMLGTAYVVTLNAQDCVAGTVLAEEQVQAASKETVLAALGDAVSSFRKMLGESLASVERYDAKIEQATTPSLEALKAYSQGLRTRRTTGDFDSVPFFRRATDLDPEFALAYARLGTVYSNLSQADEGRKMTARAYELRAKVSEAERLYIEARYYTVVEPDVQKALDTYRVWLATYPNEYVALSNAAILLKQLGEREEALRYQEAAIRVAPDQPTAWGNLGDTYLQLGRTDDARKAFETTLKLQDSAGARISLFVLGTVTGDQALAEAQVDAMRGRREEMGMLGVRSQAEAFRGRMAEASRLAVEWQARMGAASQRQRTGTGLIGLAISEALVGLEDQARARRDAAEDDELLQADSADERLLLAAILRDADAAHDVLPAALTEGKKGATGGTALAEGERLLRALALLAEDKPADALAQLGPISFDAAHTEGVTVWSLIQLELEDWSAAAKGLAFLDSDAARRGLGAFAPFTLVKLALAQTRLGQTDQARRTYQRFFDLWKDADPDVPLLIEARAAFEKLGS